MKKYKLDLKQLNIEYNMIKYAIDNIDDEEVLEQLKDGLKTYNFLFRSFKKNGKGIAVFDDNLCDYELNDLINDFSETYDDKDLKSILKIILISYCITCDYLVYKKQDSIPIRENNERIVEVAIDFFDKMTPAYIKKEFNKIIDDRNNVLDISYSRSVSDYAGIVLIEPIFKNRFILIKRSNLLRDYNILPHEAFHYIFIKDTSVNRHSFNSYFLAELEGSLADMLFAKYYEEYSDTNKLYFSTSFINGVISTIEDLVIRNALFASLKDNGNIRMNKLNKLLALYSFIPFEKKEEINEYLEIPQEIQMKYSLSHLAAFDLFNIYNKDPDKCFYLLKNIKYNIQENDIIQLLRNNEITFMDDECENMKKYMINFNNKIS